MRELFWRKENWFRLFVAGFALMLSACIYEQRLNTETALHRLRQIREAQEAYRTKSENGSYGSIEQLASAGLIPKELLDREDYSYKYELSVSNESYTVTAEPIKEGNEQKLGNSFFMDQTGVIRASNEHFKPATASSDPIGKQ